MAWCRRCRRQGPSWFCERCRGKQDALREVVDIVFKDRPCADCGRRYPPEAMDFDHVRGEKIAPISQLVNRIAPLRVVVTEIRKCDLVCSNCHRTRGKRRTGEQREWRQRIQRRAEEVIDEDVLNERVGYYRGRNVFADRWDD